jgi:hypothetical protein
MQSASLDRAADYAYDVFRKIQEIPSHLQNDVRALARFVMTVNGADDGFVQALVYRHGWFSDEVLQSLSGAVPIGAVDLVAMVRRWASDSLNELRSHCNAKSRKIFGIRRH